MTQKQIFNLPIGAGQYTEQSERGAVGRWYIMDKVRFRKGLAEKIGGWVQLQPPFLGLCRRLKDWSSLDSKRWAAIGTDVKLYVWQVGGTGGGTLFDITPLRREVTLTAPFTTENSPSLNVTVLDTNHGAQKGDYVTFSGGIVGASSGIFVDGEYIITSIVDNNNYTITVASAATGPGAAGEGGTPLAEYDISTGGESVVTATGYGAGPYGAEGYGSARTGSFFTVGIRTWALDTWGEDLLASPRKGAIYWWDRSKGTGQRAVALTGDAPPQNEYMIVSQRDRHIIALGAYDYFNSAFDPLLIRWSSTEDLNDWVPTSTNTSGDLRLYSGSKIVTGVRSRLETVIFTDVSVHTLPFVGGFDVFGLNIVGENVSILGPNAAVPIDHRVIFMAESDFYVYDGIVKVLPCDVRNLVYDNLNTVQRDKVYGGLNREFNEVWFYYPSYDINAWVQTTFTVGQTPGYQIADSSNLAADPYYDNVVLLAKFDGNDAVQAYTEIARDEPGVFIDNAQLDTAVKAAGTASLLVDGTGDAVQFGPDAASAAAYNIGATGTATIEGFITLASLPASSQRMVIVAQWADDVKNFWIEIYNTGSEYRLRADFGAGNFAATYTTITPSTGQMYHFAVQFVANSYMEFYFTEYNGTPGIALTNYAFRAKQGSGPETMTAIGPIMTIGAMTNSGIIREFDGHIDSIRFTNGTRRYTETPSTKVVPDPDYPEGSVGSLADVGYTVAFDGGGYTEVIATADNNYEHDYFLINDEPILTPLESEYAVELDVNPLYAGSGRAGLCFLRTNLTGSGNTDADDAQQLMFTIDYANNQAAFYKKTSSGVAAPTNLGANTVNFTTLTGSAMVIEQKYILSVQFDTPTITAWVDGIQAFQFALDATELTQFASGSMGLHQTPGTTNDLYRFYNLAAGPLGTITDPDFDISPIEVNRYVAFNYEEGSWVSGKLARTAWADRSPLLEKPYAAGIDGYLYQHETGADDNGAAMPAYIESFDMEIPSAGEELMHVDQLIPDFLTLEGDVSVYLTGRKYPQDPNRISKGPYTVADGTRKLSTRIRARQIAIRVESDGTGDKWRMGNWRGRAGPHGKRG